MKVDKHPDLFHRKVVSSDVQHYYTGKCFTTRTCPIFTNQRYRYCTHYTDTRARRIIAVSDRITVIVNMSARTPGR